MTPLPDDIRLVYEDRPGYLFASVTGPRDSQQISLAYWSNVFAEATRRGARKVMVAESLGDREDTRDLPALVDALIRMGFDRLQVAFVVGRIELLPSMEHGEILAVERGANGRVFADAATAEQWLRHGGG